MADTRKRNQLSIRSARQIEANAGDKHILLCLSPVSYSLLYRLSLIASFWSWWSVDTQDDYNDVDRYYSQLRNELHKTMCLEDLQDSIDQQTIDIVNAINSLPDALRDIMTNTITFNPTITQTVTGCGCGGNGGTPSPNPDPTTDPPITPPNLSDDPIPTNTAYATALCKRAQKASKSYADFFRDFKQVANTAGNLTDELFAIAASSAVFAPYVAYISALIGAFAVFVGFYPFDEIIEFLDETEAERTCILYTATTPRGAFDTYRDFIYRGLIEKFGEISGRAIFAVMIYTIMLLDFEIIYAEDSTIDVSDITEDCSTCDGGPGGGGGNGGGDGSGGSVANITDWSSLNVCLSQANFNGQISSGTVIGMTENSITFRFDGDETTSGVVFELPNLTNLLGFALRTSEVTGNPALPAVGGLGGAVHIATEFVNISNDVVIFASSQLFDQLSSLPATVVDGFNDAGQFFYARGENGSIVKMSEFYWLHECPTDGRFYLETDSNYLITPPNWLISGGQTFIIHDNTANDGTPIDTIPDLIIESGLIVNGSAVKFIDWQSTAPTVIKLSAYRIQNQFGNSPKLVVLIRNHGEETIQSRFVLDMVNENEIYTLETPLINSGQYDIEIIGTGPGGDGPLGNVVVYDVSSQ